MPQKRIRSRRDTGDVLTGDGIQRVSAEQPLLTPDRGEGGSVLQALGSKAEERVKRRKKKKDSYAQYLESAPWKKIRAAVLKRDKRTCRACSRPAWVVHHVRYPKNLGQEKMEWLYSLCAPCHDEIHRRALLRGITLRAATKSVIAGTEISPRLTKSQKLRARKKKKQPAPLQGFSIRTGGPRISAGTKKRTVLQIANDELHERQKRARENRERREHA